MLGWWIFGWSLLWLIGFSLTLTWVLRGSSQEATDIYWKQGVMLCLFFWPIVLGVQAAMVLSGKTWKPKEPFERLCGCGPDHVAFGEWTPDEVAAGKKFRHRCCYKVTEERLRARAERRRIA